MHLQDKLILGDKFYSFKVDELVFGARWANARVFNMHGVASWKWENRYAGTKAHVVQLTAHRAEASFYVAEALAISQLPLRFSVASLLFLAWIRSVGAKLGHSAPRERCSAAE